MALLKRAIQRHKNLMQYADQCKTQLEMDIANGRISTSASMQRVAQQLDHLYDLYNVRRSQLCYLLKVRDMYA